LLDRDEDDASLNPMDIEEWQSLLRSTPNAAGERATEINMFYYSNLVSLTCFIIKKKVHYCWSFFLITCALFKYQLS
jgi:hypothetical protein